ncbi:MAG: hypothetical protein JWN76_2889 [Chitinophagaceae bacterium]|nr:hypothetical protein [Chitinophagaceae bacterium]
MRILTLVFCLIGYNLFAQKKIAVYVSPSMGSVSNESINLQLQLATGIGFAKKFDVGIGAGRDNYNTHSTPIFIETKTYFHSRRKSNLFIYANGGINIPDKNKDPVYSWSIASSNTSGYYADAGTGYTFLKKNKASLYTSIGYCRKTYMSSFEETNYSSGLKSTHSYTYTFNRISVKIGVRIGK